MATPATMATAMNTDGTVASAPVAAEVLLDVVEGVFDVVLDVDAGALLHLGQHCVDGSLLVLQCLAVVDREDDALALLEQLGLEAREQHDGRQHGGADRVALGDGLRGVATASRASVCTRTSCGRPDISAMPPALSVIGPKASSATIRPVSDSWPMTATPMP